MQPVRFSHSQRWTCVLRFNHSPFFDAWIVNNSIFRSINVRERLSKYNSVSGHKALCASAISASWCTKPGLCGSMQEKCILELHFTQSNSLLNPLGSFLEFGISDHKNQTVSESKNCSNQLEIATMPRR
jgi:hypothetical protein